MDLQDVFREVCQGIMGSQYTLGILNSASEGDAENVPTFVRRMVGEKVKARSEASWNDIERMMSYDETVADLIQDVVEEVWNAMRY